jgi:hypothetical protein
VARRRLDQVWKKFAATVVSEWCPSQGRNGLPIFFSKDLGAQHELARGNLALYTGFPYLQRMWRESGFATEADAMANGVGPPALSDALLDSFSLSGHSHGAVSGSRST